MSTAQLLDNSGGGGSLDARAEVAHAQAETPEPLLKQAATLAEQAVTRTEQKVRAGLQNLKREATEGAAALEAVVAGTATKKQLSTAAQTLKVVADVAGKVGPLLKPGGTKKLPKVLKSLLPGALQTLLPGVKLADIKKGLAIAERVASFARKPGLRGAAGLLKMLRGSKGTTAVDFLISGVVNIVSGEKFDLTRFLTGALTATSKDLKARALALVEP